MCCYQEFKIAFFTEYQLHTLYLFHFSCFSFLLCSFISCFHTLFLFLLFFLYSYFNFLSFSILLSISILIYVLVSFLCPFLLIFFLPSVPLFVLSGLFLRSFFLPLRLFLVFSFASSLVLPAAFLHVIYARYNNFLTQSWVLCAAVLWGHTQTYIS
jgi:hypothetical protein